MVFCLALLTDVLCVRKAMPMDQVEEIGVMIITERDQADDVFDGGIDTARRGIWCRGHRSSRQSRRRVTGICLLGRIESAHSETVII